MLNSSILINVVFGKPETAGGADGAIITVAATGPSGCWQVSVPTVGSCLKKSLTKMLLWEKLATDYANYTGTDKELDYFTPLEGGLEIALFATAKGPAVEARDCPRSSQLRPHTRVWAKPEEIAVFVQHLAKTVTDESLGAKIGHIPEYQDLPYGQGCHGSQALLKINTTGISTSVGVPTVHIPWQLSITALAFLKKKLADLAIQLNPASQYFGPETFYYLIPESDICLQVTIFTDDESNHRKAAITIDNSFTGPLWTIEVLTQDLIFSVESFQEHGEITLFGQISNRLPL